jgi:hypothetical protein
MSNQFKVTMESESEVEQFRQFAKMQGFASLGAFARFTLQQYADRYKLEEKLLRRFAVPRAGISSESVAPK